MDTKLYPGIAFSPQAQLTDNIGAADTIIPVSDVSAFPPAPNLATIGTDEEGETILYAAKTAEALSGCVRGVEGVAKPWSAGESIGRNFTAVDHAALISAAEENDATAKGALELAGSARDSAEGAGGAAAAAQAAAQAAADAVSELREAVDSALALKQPLLAGQPGQVVGFDGEGKAAAMDMPAQARGGSGVQLLDNAYWAIPECIINQRGVSGTITAKGYFIDRWKLVSGSVTIMDGGLLLNGTMAQILETDPGQEVTASYFTDDGVFPAEYDSESRTFAITAEGALLRAAKLELGAVQTLAHQDTDGNWVFNDPPPNKALELGKCQRYQVIISISSSNGLAREKNAYIYISLPTALRAKPAISYSGASIYRGVNKERFAITNISVVGVNDCGIYVLVYQLRGRPGGVWHCPVDAPQPQGRAAGLCQGGGNIY